MYQSEITHASGHGVCYEFIHVYVGLYYCTNLHCPHSFMILLKRRGSVFPSIVSVNTKERELQYIV